MTTAGTFVRPIGVTSYGYCYEVRAVLPADTDHRWGPEPEHWSCTRWDLDTDAMQPLDDGHVTSGHSITGLVEISPGVWRETHVQGCYPGLRYWRAIAVRGQQLGLFA